ncbi:hypothetical protein RND81_14G185300 [Saponaria officinalis]|uniref:Uncharacterized protein n=1 Tax=Saponaria officinalis TaxID=3572 RepID=A0AAW1GRS3_SAPOF
MANTWMMHREKFCRCYTNKVAHFENTTTFRVEAAHTVLKDWLSSSTLSMDSIWIRIDALLIGQHVEIKKALQTIGTRFHEHHRPLFLLLSGHVAKRALWLMNAEWTRGVTLCVGLVDGCGCAYRRTHRLLCACRLHELRSKDRRVHLDDIHMFWRTLVFDDSTPRQFNDDSRLEELLEELRDSDST